MKVRRLVEVCVAGAGRRMGESKERGVGTTELVAGERKEDGDEAGREEGEGKGERGGCV